ncbi:MAG: hypothetical protein HKO63_06930 [Acidimicrobiia bacterium]|nr:hypothetical protein [Acidimicrobiia bacterium]NNF88343.1 hypothetical protein [Acidimicrobiia bacterium]NNJ48464.1 hypothetical protein [Acidimicrobiia bacterium]NNL97922.1 hypothetical protein [Acidimicrobiia bacterium]
MDVALSLFMMATGVGFAGEAVYRWRERRRWDTEGFPEPKGKLDPEVAERMHRNFVRRRLYFGIAMGPMLFFAGLYRLLV